MNHNNMKIKDLKEIIREKEDLDQKAQIKLLYTGTVLDEGDKATPKRLVDYNFFNEAEKWSGPCAGILWVAPELIYPGFGGFGMGDYEGEMRHAHDRGSAVVV